MRLQHAAVTILLLSGLTAAFAGSATFTSIQTMTSWKSCTTCAGTGQASVFTMKQAIATPSLDGHSAEFFISGGPGFSKGLWWRRMSSDTSATHFVLDMNYYMDRPAASQGLEFAANQAVNGGWYKFSTQCSFAKGVWSAWDSKNGGWVSTGIPCVRPSAYTWTHARFEYARSGGKAIFVSITLNGVKHYANKSFYPQSTSASGSVGIHFQLNGNRNMDPYGVWVDQMALNYW